MCKTLNEIAQEIHALAIRNGWWDEPRNFGEIIALCHSELSEALEEYRDGRPMMYYHCDGHICYMEGCDHCDMIAERNDKPEGIAVELADVIIRILDYCGKENIDIEKAIQIKHDYNRSRPYRHGGKVI